MARARSGKAVEAGKGPTRDKSEPLTVGELEKLLIRLSRIIVRFGGIYLPLFERAERELAWALQAESAMNRVRRLAKTGQVDQEFYLTQFDGRHG
jgi:hypothetical protein